MASAGDVILMRVEEAARFMKTPNARYLKEIGTKEVKKLSGGHYQIIPRKVVNEIKAKQSAASAPAQPATEVSDKSMSNKPKRKSKGRRG
jgi:hypothetical protein